MMLAREQEEKNEQQKSDTNSTTIDSTKKSVKFLTKSHHKFYESDPIVLETWVGKKIWYTEKDMTGMTFKFQKEAEKFRNGWIKEDNKKYSKRGLESMINIAQFAERHRMEFFSRQAVLDEQNNQKRQGKKYDDVIISKRYRANGAAQMQKLASSIGSRDHDEAVALYASDSSGNFGDTGSNKFKKAQKKVLNILKFKATMGKC